MSEAKRFSLSRRHVLRRLATTAGAALVTFGIPAAAAVGHGSRVPECPLWRMVRSPLTVALLRLARWAEPPLAWVGAGIHLDRGARGIHRAGR